MSLEEVEIIDLPKISDVRGNLTFIESNKHIPFDIKRVYYIYDIPGGESRGGHAHKKLQQFLIAMSGSFEIILDDGRTKKSFYLNRAYYGLYIPRLIWRDIRNFSSGAVCMCLASDYYDEKDYIRDYNEFKKYIKDNL